MKKIAVFALLISLLFVYSSCAKQGEQKEPYLAKVGTVKITNADLEREMENLPPFAQKIFEGSEGKEKFLNELVKKELLYQEALKQGLEKDAEYVQKVEDFKKITLIGKLLEKEIEERARVTDEDVKRYYDEHKEDFSPSSQIRLSLIRVKTEDDANNILDKLQKGEDFSKLARESSTDAHSAKSGGDLGFISRDQISQEYQMAIVRLKKGELSDPIKTQHGYDIIKVTDKKATQVIEFEKVKDLISQHLSAEKQKEVFDSYIENLKKTYTVEINKEALAGPPAGEEKESMQEEPGKTDDIKEGSDKVEKESEKEEEKKGEEKETSHVAP